MVNLIGTYECKADAKGRLMLPSALKKQMEAYVSEGFVIKRSVFQSCLELYPMSEWNELMHKINKLNRFKKKHNDFIRRFTAGVKQIDVDSTGRILIPKDLTAFAGIKKELVLAGTGKVIEIWDKDSYEQAVNEVSDDFADLAEEVMGSIGEYGE